MNKVEATEWVENLALRIYRETRAGRQDSAVADITNQIQAALRYRDREWAKAAREALDSLTCPDCEGTGTLGEYKGKPVSCEKCYGHEDAAGLGYVLDGDNVVEKLQRLAALVEVKENG